MKGKDIQLYIPFLGLTFDSLFSIDIFDNKLDVVSIDKGMFLKKCRENNIEYHIEYDFENNKIWIVKPECKCECDNWGYSPCNDDCEFHKDISITEDCEWVRLENYDYEIIEA